MRPAGERRLQRSRPAPRAGSPTLYPASPYSVGARSDGIRGRKRARGQVALSTRLLRVSRKLAEGCKQIAVRVLFWLPRGRIPASASLSAGFRNAGAVGPRWSSGAAAGSGKRLVITFARLGRLPGSQIPSPSRTFELRLDSFSLIPEGLETPSF